MNREIRFREWDGLRFFHVNIDSDDKIFQLSTGLKDKNNKEIYEGDIIKYVYELPFPENEKKFQWETIGQVIFSNGCFGILTEDKKYDSYKGTLSNYPAVLVEVVGNIFENPELLNA